jgi:CRISPR/Cas system-associated exonuclease Cas4 (RecB family)
MGYGNLIHEMMERIEQENDVEQVLEQFVNKGILRKEELHNIRNLVLSIVQHPILRPYFEPGLMIINEREILTESGQVIIPDRLIIEQQNVTVIDYKTGKPNKSHQLQIDNYAVVLQKLNYKVLDKILVYIDENITIMKS